MKKIISISAAVFLFGAIFLASCEKTEEPAPTNSTTNNSFTGAWHNSENSVLNGANTYPITIEAPNTSSISFAYLYGFSTKVSATVSGNNFTIPNQTVEGTSVSGSGVLANSNQINMVYIVDVDPTINSDNDTVTAVLTK